jgi:hypothetical protein
MAHQKVRVSTHDPLLIAMRSNIDCGYHLEQIDSTPEPPKPKRKPSLDYYDNIGGYSASRRAFTMQLHGVR